MRSGRELMFAVFAKVDCGDIAESARLGLTQFHARFSRRSIEAKCPDLCRCGTVHAKVGALQDRSRRVPRRRGPGPELHGEEEELPLCSFIEAGMVISCC